MSDPDEEAATDAEMPRKALPAAAQRALKEAGERRAVLDARQKELSTRRELAGRGGLDPVRYEDWEVKGIASDF
mgnify:CR=1 FL=1